MLLIDDAETMRAANQFRRLLTERGREEQAVTQGKRRRNSRNKPASPRSRTVWLTHTRALSTDHVSFGLLDRAFEFRREFEFIFDQIIKPFANLTQFCLRKSAQFGFYLLDFTHVQMME